MLASSRQRVGALDASKPEDREEIEALRAKVVDITAYADANRFINRAVYSDLPEVLNEIGSTITAPRADDANTVSVIDTTRYEDPDAPSPAAAQAPTPVEQKPLSPAAQTPEQ